MKTKIPLLVLHTDFRYLRGGEKYMYELLYGLQKIASVTLLVEHISPEWKTKLKKIGVSIHTLWRPWCCYWFLVPLFLCINWWKYRSFISPETIVFATNFPLNFLAVLLTKKNIIFCFEPLSIFYDNNRLWSMRLKDRLILSIAKALYWRLDYYAIKNANRLATLNKNVAALLWKIYKKKPDLYLPNSIPVKILKRGFYKSNKNTKILHSTDFTILKGTDIFIQSMLLIIPWFPNLQVSISESVPNKEMKKKYLTLIKKLGLQRYVYFEGTIPDHKMKKWYQSGSVFCFTGSPYCGGGATASLSVLESQSQGTPVIRSKGGDQEIIEGKTGFFITKYSPEGVAKAILKFLRLSKKQQTIMSSASVRHIKNHFSPLISEKKLAETILKLHNEI